MNIASAAYVLSAPANLVAITMEDGAIWHTEASLPPDTSLRAALSAWLAAGNAIAPCAGPPPDQLWANLRAERNRRLAASDWTQLADAPTDGPVYEAWCAYRQTLRDLPENTADPAAPVWPMAPG